MVGAARQEGKGPSKGRSQLLHKTIDFSLLSPLHSLCRSGPRWSEEKDVHRCEQRAEPGTLGVRGTRVGGVAPGG